VEHRKKREKERTQTRRMLRIFKDKTNRNFPEKVKARKAWIKIYLRRGQKEKRKL